MTVLPPSRAPFGAVNISPAMPQPRRLPWFRKKCRFRARKRHRGCCNRLIERALDAVTVPRSQDGAPQRAHRVRHGSSASLEDRQPYHRAREPRSYRARLMLPRGRHVQSCRAQAATVWTISQWGDDAPLSPVPFPQRVDSVIVPINLPSLARAERTSVPRKNSPSDHASACIRWASVTGLGLSIPLASSSRRLVLLSGVGAWPPPDGCLREDRPANLGTRGRSATAHLAV